VKSFFVCVGDIHGVYRQFHLSGKKPCTWTLTDTDFLTVKFMV